MILCGGNSKDFRPLLIKHGARVIFKDAPDTPPKQYHRSEVTPLGRTPKNGEKKEETEA